MVEHHNEVVTILDDVLENFPVTFDRFTEDDVSITVYGWFADSDPRDFVIFYLCGNWDPEGNWQGFSYLFWTSSIHYSEKLNLVMGSGGHIPCHRFSELLKQSNGVPNGE